MLEPEHLKWLEARRISADMAQRFGLKTSVQLFPPEPGSESDQWVKAKCISVPFIRDGKAFNHKHRRTTIKQHVMDKGAPLGLWNEDGLKRAAGGTWVLTEGEWDGIVAEELGWAASSVPNGAPNKATGDVANSKRYEFLWDVRDDIAKVERIIIASDGDEAGMYLRADLIALFGPVKCSFVEYPEGCKDLTDVVVKHGVEAANRVLMEAKPVPVDSLHRLSDFPDMPPLPLEPLLGVADFDEMWGLVPATFSVITGYPGHGKSSIVFKLLANALAKGVNVGLGSFETVPKPVLERRLLAAMDERAEHDLSIWSNYKARRIMEERLVLFANTPDEDHELDLDRFLDLAEVAVQRYGIKLLVIDPFNEMEHKRGRDESETEYHSRFIRSIKRFAHRTQVAVWMVAHPRKPSTDGAPKYPPSLYDLAGSAHWNNKADYGLVVHRPDLTANTIIARVTKVRMGLPGRCGQVLLEFLPAQSKYVRTYDATVEDE
jgi:twinkle protein